MKYKNGFTLVELVIVIAVIGILAGLAIPHFLDSQAKTRSARAAADMRILQSAIEQYVAAGHEVPAMQKNQSLSNGKIMFEKLKEKGFISSIPEAPKGAYYNAVSKARDDYPAPAYGVELSATGTGPNRYLTVNFLTEQKDGPGIYLNMYLNWFIYGNVDV